MIKKNIILTSANADDNPNYKGIVTIEADNKNTYINLKTYNIKNVGKIMFGLQQNKNFYKVEVNNLNQTNNFKIEAPIDLNDKISCVLISVNNNTASPLIWGSNETNKVWQNSFLFNMDDTSKNNLNLEEEIKPSSLNYQNSEINQNLNSFVTSSSAGQDDYETDEEIEKIVDNSIKDLTLNENFVEDGEEKESDFYNSIKNQVEDLLSNYENEKALEEIIPNSKFVKVDYENNGDYYIFGVIYEEGKIRYIVYGLPGEFSVKPNDEYASFYQWLPLDSENPEGYGYYLMYQDAQNGDSIKIDII